MVKQHQLVIILPEDMADIPVRIINNPDSMELVLTTLPSDGTPAVRSERGTICAILLNKSLSNSLLFLCQITEFAKIFIPLPL